MQGQNAGSPPPQGGGLLKRFQNWLLAGLGTFAVYVTSQIFSPVLEDVTDFARRQVYQMWGNATEIAAPVTKPGSSPTGISRQSEADTSAPTVNSSAASVAETSAAPSAGITAVRFPASRPVDRSPAESPSPPAAQKLITVQEGETISLCGFSALLVIAPAVGDGLRLEQTGVLPSERRAFAWRLGQINRLEPACSVELRDIKRSNRMIFDLVVSGGR